MDTKIRHFDVSDYDDVIEIYRFPAVTQYTSQLPHLHSETIKSFFQNPLHYILVAEQAGKVVGHVTLLISHKLREKHAASLAIAVHPDFHGQGIGRLLMHQAIDQADNWLNLGRIELEVNTDNLAAIHLYQTLDFELEGEKRFCTFQNGKYANILMMARIKPALLKQALNA